MMLDFPPLTDSLLIFAASIIAGAMNAVAGGGTFFAFPALIFTGVPSVIANATCSVAVWPGAMASAWAYRKEMTENRDILPSMLAIALFGGAIGALLLLAIPEQAFDAMVPWLLLVATLLFAFGRRITHGLPKWLDKFSSLRGGEADEAIQLERHGRDIMSSAPQTRRAGLLRFARNDEINIRRLLAYLFQLFIAIYGGFFGAGIGILNLAMLEMLGMKNIHAMNGLKTIIGAAINATAVAVFVFYGVVAWPQAVVMVAGAVIGGYFGARIALKVPQLWLRRFVIAVGTLLTVYFFAE